MRACWNGSGQRACSRQRLLEVPERAIGVAKGGREQPAAPRQDRKGPRPVQVARAILPGPENLLGLRVLASCDEGLQEVADLRTHTRFPPAAGIEVPGGHSEVGERGHGITLRQLEEPQHVVVHCLMHRLPCRLGGGDGAEGARASVVDEPSMGGEDRAGIFVDRPQPFRAGLVPDRRQLIRIVCGELPVACPPLDERKEPVAPRGVGVFSGEGRFQLSCWSSRAPST